MSANGDPPDRRPRRLSPDELAGEVARRLKLDRGGHRRAPRIDVVTVSRIVMGFGVVLLGLGVFAAANWIGGLSGFETTGTVNLDTEALGCPGEPPIGFLFSGETVELVGRTADGRWYAVRDRRGRGNVVYADASAITPAEDPSQLKVRSCDPRSADEVAAAQMSATTGIAGDLTTTTTMVPVTTLPGITTTTVEDDSPSPARPRRRGSPSPGTTTTTTTTRPGGPTTVTTRPPVTTTTRPGTPTTSTTQPTTSTTRPPTTTSTTRAPTTTTTTTQPTTTTTEPPTTTTTEPVTTTTEAETTTTTSEP